MTGAALADGGSPFSLPPEAAQWASRVRAFVEQELQPYERHAELNQGRLPDGVAERHERLALELGLSRIDVPREFGGLELSMLTQVAIAEELGRATNALSWCFPEAQAWMFEAFDAAQIDRYALPMTRAERHLCYAITEETPAPIPPPSPPPPSATAIITCFPVRNGTSRASTWPIRSLSRRGLATGPMPER